MTPAATQPIPTFIAARIATVAPSCVCLQG